MLETILDILKDATLDTLYLIPFLYLTYLFMEWLNLKTEEKTFDKLQSVRATGPFFGALLGLIPQCGFSASAAALYAARVVTRGTLIAVFLTTSDEMIPIFIAKAVPVEQILAVLAGKLVIGIVAGFAIDIVLNLMHRNSTEFRLKEVLEDDSEDYEFDEDTARFGYEDEFAVPDDYSQFEDMFPTASDEEMEAASAHPYECDCAACVGGIPLTPKAAIFVLALMHTLQVTLFIFLVNLGLDAVIEFVGEDALGAIVAQNELLSIFASALVGLIPNCAASVVIADLWVDGVLTNGAMFAGLLVSCGIGLLVLFEENKDVKRNLSIVATLLVISIASGLIISILPF